MIVLSLFGGMECGRITLDKMGIIPTAYYSSEIDKFARKEVMANYPDVIQLGDVTKWSEWDIPWGDIDMVIGGSPCQGFSFAGKQLAFNDPRSALFFEYVNILEFVKLHNPDVAFMLENVKMKKEHLAVISQSLGVEPVFINSALVCAQNRQRYYWCNWDVPQPEDRGIVLADILEVEGVGHIKSHGEWKERDDKSQCIDANYHKGVDNHGQRTQVKIGRVVGRKINPTTGKRDDYNPDLVTEQRPDDKCGTLTTVQKDNILQIVDRDKSRALTTSCGKSNNPKLYKEGRKGNLVFLEMKPRGNNPGGKRAEDGKTPSMTANSRQDNFHLSDGIHYRKLTVVECCRLQGVPDDYFKVSSNTQAYKMLGNGWQCDTIEHIFQHCPVIYR